MYATRVRFNFKVEGENVNFLKSKPINIPQDLRDHFPNMGVRFALRQATGSKERESRIPAMVSIYLIPRNGARNLERELVETVVLSFDPKVNYSDGRRTYHPSAMHVREAVPDSLVGKILTDYILARTNQ